MLQKVLRVLLPLLALAPAALLFAALLGLGLHRHAPLWAISSSATLLVLVPPLCTASAVKEERGLTFGVMLLPWSIAVWLALPVYFPGERADAVRSGLAALGLSGELETYADQVAEQLPDEPELASQELPVAAAAVDPAAPPPTPLDDHQIALPYEGKGRRLSVPVVFGHEGTSEEVFMMLDTGATYTTLPSSLLDRLGVVQRPTDPVITLHTANGERQARVILLDEVWLGDLKIEGVAITVCDDCGSGDNLGLLGLNVAGGFNMNIDADRQEVVFSKRAVHDRSLDVKLFSELEASFSRYPGGRVEVEMGFDNFSGRVVSDAVARVTCGEKSWTLPFARVGADERVTQQRRLPSHPRCERYRYQLESAQW